MMNGLESYIDENEKKDQGTRCVISLVPVNAQLGRVQAYYLLTELRKGLEKLGCQFDEGTMRIRFREDNDGKRTIYSMGEGRILTLMFLHPEKTLDEARLARQVDDIVKSITIPPQTFHGRGA